MRAIPDDFDHEVVAAIDARLDGVVAEHGVSVPWAIESGSRAWGFASPDSDYDCRFLYVRPRDDYLDPWAPRDVIETPLDGLLDVNGWDLRKAVKLMVVGNATVGEWLRSPWVYRGDRAFADELIALADDVVDRAGLRRHYLHVARDQWAHASDGENQVRLKRVFYAVRPAVTLHWLDEHTGVPPMNLDELMSAVSLPEAVSAEIAALREAKSRTRELGTAPVPPAIAAWVGETLAREDDSARTATPEVRRRARDGFIGLVERWAPVA